MTNRQLRWLLLMVASALITVVVLRRRQQLADAIPQPLFQGAERFVIPWPSADRKSASSGPDEDGIAAEEEEPEADATDSTQRKVSTNSRISFRGKRYGPLPEALVGQYVDVETRNDQLFVLHEGQPIATFTLQS